MCTSRTLKERHFRDILKMDLGKLGRSIHANRISLNEADKVRSPDFCYLTYFSSFRDQNCLGI